jgi:hypothetical protein
MMAAILKSVRQGGRALVSSAFTIETEEPSGSIKKVNYLYKAKCQCVNHQAMQSLPTVNQSAIKKVPNRKGIKQQHFSIPAPMFKEKGKRKRQRRKEQYKSSAPLRKVALIG